MKTIDFTELINDLNKIEGIEFLEIENNRILKYKLIADMGLITYRTIKRLNAITSLHSFSWAVSCPDQILYFIE